MPSSNRSSLSNPNRNPGPGSYSLSANPEGPFFSLKGRNSSTKPFKTPGPGNYDPNYYATLETIPSFRVGSSKRDFPLSSNSTPGPGNYDPVVSPLKTSEPPPRQDLQRHRPVPSGRDPNVCAAHRRPSSASRGAIAGSAAGPDPVSPRSTTAASAGLPPRRRLG